MKGHALLERFILALLRVPIAVARVIARRRDPPRRCAICLIALPPASSYPHAQCLVCLAEALAPPIDPADRFPFPPESDTPDADRLLEQLARSATR